MANKDMVEFFTTDNYVLISRISALFNAEDMPFMVLGNHASLFGGGIAGIGQRMMIEEENIQKALRLIREIGLEKEIIFAPGLQEPPQK